MSRYAALVSREPFELRRTIRVGRVPYWSASSEDGKYCFVSVAGGDRVGHLLHDRSGGREDQGG